VSAVKSVLLAIVVATRKKDQAGKVLMHVQRACAFAQGQLNQLESYATETDVRWTETAQVGATTELIRHHYQFMERLQHAIGLQQGVVESASRRVEEAKKLELQAQFRLTGLKQVLKKKQAEIVLVETRRDQKQMDEFAALRHRHPADTYI
jgi:flagellar FliJ protein